MKDCPTPFDAKRTSIYLMKNKAEFIPRYQIHTINVYGKVFSDMSRAELRKKVESALRQGLI